MTCACATQKRDAHAHYKMTCVYASCLELRMRISFWAAHAHLIFGLRIRISFSAAHVHLIMGCACASHFGLRKRISFSAAHAHLILRCACASHFGLRIRTSFWCERAFIIFNLIFGNAYGKEFRPNMIKKIKKHALLNLLKSQFFVYYLTHTLVTGVKFN